MNTLFVSEKVLREQIVDLQARVTVLTEEREGLSARVMALEDLLQLERAQAADMAATARTVEADLQAAAATLATLRAVLAADLSRYVPSVTLNLRAKTPT